MVCAVLLAYCPVDAPLGNLVDGFVTVVILVGFFFFAPILVFVPVCRGDFFDMMIELAACLTMARWLWEEKLFMLLGEQVLRTWEGYLDLEDRLAKML